MQLPRQYKRVHQQALRHVQGKRFEQAAEFLDAFDAAGTDAESEFLRVLLEVGRGDLEAASRAAAEAVRRGLPAGRLVAGPRELLSGLESVPEFRELIVATGPLVHGPMLGCVEAQSARIWARTAASGTVRVIARGGVREVDGAAESSAETDFTSVVRLDGLRPGTEHEYVLWVGGERAAQGSFRTAPLTGARGRFTLAFGGGAGYVPAHERMWDTIRESDPDLLLLLGDNVYIDAPGNDAMQRYCYYRRQSVPAFRRLVSGVPVLSIWDDHDFGTNDCSGGSAVNRPVWKLPVWRRFAQNWANPGYGGGESDPGCWYSFSWGDVEFFMLDGRYYRTPPASTEPAHRSMLGPVQKLWLEDRLRASRATFKVLCSPVPWDYRTKGDSLDTWNGFRHEREELFELLADQRVEGVVLMSADRHRSDAWRIDREGIYDLYEFSSSRLTNQHVHPTMSAAELSYNDKQSFGLVTFDTTVDDPTVTYVVRNIDGEDVGGLQVRLSQLR